MRAVVLVFWFLLTCFVLQPQAGASPPALLLAEVAPHDIDPTDYLVSEKLDGVRAYWDGERLYFRSGNEVQAPKWFLEKLPKRPLDGELWLARGKFDELSGQLRAHVARPGFWRSVRYMIFELPPINCAKLTQSAGELPCNADFAARYQGIKNIIRAANFPQLCAVEQQRFATPAALQHWFAQIIAQGGEGAMLHLASAPYQRGRSDVLLKLKAHYDAEAVVLGYLPGKGRLTGLMGSLRVQTQASNWFAAGIEFRLGTGFNLAQRREPPAIGSLVSFRFRGKTVTGKPRFASFLRVREDP